MTRPALTLTQVDKVPAELLDEARADALQAGDSWLLHAGEELAGAVVVNGGLDACLRLLYVRPAWRGLGYGSEAVGAVLEHLEASRARQVRALAPAGNGLSVYFWFRQGFRPERAGERGLSLVRDLVAEPS
jgi:GNAT superfamily N-acetyltransferase